MKSDLALRFDKNELRTQFNRRPFFVEHSLCGHELFELPRLIALARSQPAGCVEYNSGKLAPGQDPAATPMNGLSPEETIARIRDCNSWMVIKFVEHDPAYGELLNTLIDGLLREAGSVVPEVQRRYGFIFISSPGSVTPYHMDPEHNFLLQIRGDKHVHMWSPDDRFVLPEEQLETFYADYQHRNLPYRPEFETSSFLLLLKPGKGLHFPVTAPHWVRNGDEVSVSFSITFRSRVSDRREFLYRTKARLRKAGMNPPAVGAHPNAEELLYRLARGWRAVRRVGRISGNEAHD